MIVLTNGQRSVNVKRNFKAISDKRLIEYLKEAHNNLIKLKNSVEFKSWQQKALDKEEILIKKIEVLAQELNNRKDINESN